MPAANKKILFSLNSPAYSNQLAREALDSIMAFSAFEQSLSVYFGPSATSQLLLNQQPGTLEQKNLGKTLQAFELYEIDQLFVDQQSLQQLGLTEQQLLIPCKAINHQQYRQLIDAHDIFLDY